jgi:hypothetical protein
MPYPSKQKIYYLLISITLFMALSMGKKGDKHCKIRDFGTKQFDRHWASVGEM